MNKGYLAWAGLSLFLLSLSAQAHDPKEHAKKAEAPNCIFMFEMDMAKMDMKDPITRAMVKKCVSAARTPACEAVQQKGPAGMDMKDPVARSGMQQCVQEIRHHQEAGQAAPGTEKPASAHH